MLRILKVYRIGYTQDTFSIRLRGRTESPLFKSAENYASSRIQMQIKMKPNPDVKMYILICKLKSDTRRCWPDDCTAATERSRQEKQKSKPACPRNCRFLSARSLVSRSHSCATDFTSVFLTSGRPVSCVRWLLLSGWFFNRDGARKSKMIAITTDV